MSTAEFKRLHQSGKSICRQLRGDAVCSGNVSHRIHCTSGCSRWSPLCVKCHLFMPPFPLFSSNSCPPRARIRECQKLLILASHIFLRPHSLRSRGPLRLLTLLKTMRLFEWEILSPTSSPTWLPSPHLSSASMAPFKEKLGYKTQSCPLLPSWFFLVL